ncbi:glycosyltransferase [Aquiflexum sp. LQ15W]|uniref:glycosyltransferase n=1 Tax=Cognataquiflexum nitidum TaxID=2922272 RepID=UPI001F12FFCB|nr:glycosyltransferase [Cognataquiflexum nitidum]MCH6197998.1 glycosyltransferase [Cognataquiflexum nitidum]
MFIQILWIVFFVSLAIQLFYLLILFGRFAFFYKKKTEMSSSEKEPVTVVIAAHNERTNLKKIIPLLFQQDYPNFDIMVINDRSYDGTKKVLEQLMAIYPRLRTVTVTYTPSHVTSKKYALTLGIKVAKNDVLLLTDADCRPKTDKWIELMTAPVRVKGKDFALGFSQYESKNGFLNKWIQLETIWTAIQYFSFAIWKSPFMGVGRNLCYRRSFFMSKKAFKGLWHIECGDDDLFVNLHADSSNVAVVVDPDSMTYSVPKSTWEEYFIQKKRHFHAGKYYSTSNKQKVGWYAFSHFLYWVTSLALLIFSVFHQNWEQILVIMGIMVVRSILVTSIFRASRKKLEGNIKVFWSLIFDVMYIGYFWILGSLGYLSKKVKWK